MSEREAQLKWCPFCGPGKSIVQLYENDWSRWQIGCGACGLSSGTYAKDKKQDLINHWNNRDTDFKDCIEDLVRQFAYNYDGPVYSTGGLCALESAFSLLGWDDPHPCPENKCEFPPGDCNGFAVCGMSAVPDITEKYLSLCRKHSSIVFEYEKGLEKKQ